MTIKFKKSKNRRLHKLLRHNYFNNNILEAMPASILDVGCGSGRYYEWSKKHGIEYEGVDVDADLVKKATLRYKSRAFHTFDGKSLAQYADNSFDVVLLIEVIEHVENLDTLKNLLKECVRVAKKYTFFTTPNTSDEEFLISHRLIYHHYTHDVQAIGEGVKYKHGYAHMHHLRFTKKLLSNIFQDFRVPYFVDERVPLDIRSTREPSRKLYFKLWGFIDCRM